MRAIVFLFVLLSVDTFSQKKEQNSEKKITDKVINFVIENKDNEFIELPELYDKIATEIPNDESEKLVLAEKLKTKGFKQTDWERGNYSPFCQRIIQVTLKKGDCECLVEKIYCAAIKDDEYIMTERIKCKKTN